MKRRLAPFPPVAVVAALILAATPASAAPESHSVPVRLRNLSAGARALMVGAHPDDEDSALLAELALRRGVRATYLSLTRGEGGQNRIGTETGAALGIVRTGELLAARDIDGAEQLVGPFVDFGYSKRAEESFERWGRQSMIAVVVQAIRRVRPDVVISVWKGEASDGHGHHIACGEVTREAFDKAGDPKAFPGQIAFGLRPWRPRRLLVRERATQPDPGDLIRIDVGRRDAVLGRSPLEIAMEGRSLHRSQDMGALRPRGRRVVTYRVLAGEGLPEKGAGDDIFAGLAVGLKDWVEAELATIEAASKRRGEEAPVSRTSLLSAVDQARVSMELAWDGYHPSRPGKTAEALARVRRFLSLALAQLEELAALDAVRDRLERKLRDVDALWAQVAGLQIDLLSPVAEVSPGERCEVEVEVYCRGEASTTLLDLRALVAGRPGGVDGAPWRWIHRPEFPVALEPGSVWRARLQWTASSESRDGAVSLDPFPEPPLVVVANFESGSAPAVQIRNEAVFRSVDPGLGEVRRPLAIVPPVTLSLSPSLVVRPRGSGEAVLVQATLRWQVDGPVEGKLEFASSGDSPLTFEAPGTARDVWSLAGGAGIAQLRRVPISGLDAGVYPFSTRFVVEKGASGRLGSGVYSTSLRRVSYPHIRGGVLVEPAAARIVIVDARVTPDLRLGFLPGAGDFAPQALQMLGVEVETIDSEMLRSGELSRFDTIVVGIRALEVRQELVPHRERLWEFVRSGGTLIVQYHKPREDGPVRFVPFDGVRMTRPAARVSDETARVTLLNPAHSILSSPNRIGPSDFDGWVQERGLYFLSEWPEALEPLLESRDPGEAPRRGGLLVARMGKGHYVYCAYALFRQLPAGVPGAYRLLANLVSVPRAGD